jgi:nitrogen-specific signal transduction histidine kinase
MIDAEDSRDKNRLNPKADTADPAEVLFVQAQLARAGRNNALHALAGRLAHQIRNPLAAVRAACGGLQAEIEDCEQRETLDLMLQEIDRMLAHVRSTVQSIPGHDEPVSTVNLWQEVVDVARIVGLGHPHTPGISLSGDQQVTCELQRNAFRVAVYSIIDHLVDVSRVDAMRIALARAGDVAAIEVSVSGGDTADDSLSATWVQPVGLLVAERFARNHSGHLTRTDGGADQTVFTLRLPCKHG